MTEWIDPVADSECVFVAHGIHGEWLPVAGMTVAEIGNCCRQRFHIDPRSVPVLDGTEAEASAVVRAGQTLLFIRPAGEMGA
jgi:hypothetical protein